jgi:predicted nucleic acid-binding protein
VILVDTSVLIDYARNPSDPKLGSLFRTLPLAICGVARTELLHGSRNPRDKARLILLLDSFSQLSIPETLWDTIGDNLRLLRMSGVTIPFADAVIATVAIANDIELWTHDAHFALVQGVLPALKLFSELT